MAAKRDLSAVWTVLESTSSGTSIEAAGIGYKVTAGELLAGVDADGRRYLLVPLLPGEAAQVDTKGRAVHLIRLQHNRTQFLAVQCLLGELHAVFGQFCRELVASVQSASSPARATVEAFERWRALFSESAPKSLISEDHLIGLLGELITLERLIARSASKRLSYWTGPSGEAQDFRTTAFVMEVKSTLSREGRIVPISSIDQLEPPPGTRLYLVHHRLDRDPSGFNLDDMMNRLLIAGASRTDLEAGLRNNSVETSNLGEYSGRRYREVETRIYDVEGFAFPRLTRESFTGGTVPTGTLKISYSIDLTNEPPFPLSSDDEEHALQAMARET